MSVRLSSDEFFQGTAFTGSAIARIRSDISEAIEFFPDMRPFRASTAQGVRISVQGTLDIARATEYKIPICIVIPNDYPVSAPACSIPVPSQFQSELIAESHVLPTGVIALDRVTRWNGSEPSPLAMLIGALMNHFNEHPPLTADGASKVMAALQAPRSAQPQRQTQQAVAPPQRQTQQAVAPPQRQTQQAVAPPPQPQPVAQPQRQTQQVPKQTSHKSKKKHHHKEKVDVEFLRQMAEAEADSLVSSANDTLRTAREKHCELEMIKDYTNILQSVKMELEQAVAGQAAADSNDGDVTLPPAQEAEIKRKAAEMALEENTTALKEAFHDGSISIEQLVAVVRAMSKNHFTNALAPNLV